MEKHIVLFSTGVPSAYVAKLVLDKYGKENTVILLTDTAWEDDDNYRFSQDVQRHIDHPLTIVADGRTPEEVWLEGGYLVGPGGAPCTSKLKIAQTMKYIKELKKQGIKPILYFGISIEEEHRTYNMVNRYGPLGAECRFPLVDEEITSEQAKEIVKNEWKIELPRMYALGFSHANCGGRCVKSGAKHFIHLLETWPERFFEIALIEQKFRIKHLSDTTILVRTINKERVKITLFELANLWVRRKAAEKKAAAEKEEAEKKRLEEAAKDFVCQLELTFEGDMPCECHT